MTSAVGDSGTGDGSGATPRRVGPDGNSSSAGTTSSGASRSGAPSQARSGDAGAVTETVQAARPAVTRGPNRVAPRPTGARRPPRLTTLQLKRLDPWTVLKISLIVSIVMFFVWMIAIGVLYLSLGSLGVWDKVNTTYSTLVVTPESGDSVSDLVTPGIVFGATAIIGAVNVVLFTALSTVATFIYNAAAGMAGGMELTLGERD